MKKVYGPEGSEIGKFDGIFVHAPGGEALYWIAEEDVFFANTHQHRIMHVSTG